MTDEELDKARVNEAIRIFKAQKCLIPSTAEIAARLAREGWVPVDPDLIAAREIATRCSNTGCDYNDGEHDDVPAMQAALSGIKHGRELERNGQ